MFNNLSKVIFSGRNLKKVYQLTDREYVDKLCIAFENPKACKRSLLEFISRKFNTKPLLKLNTKDFDSPEQIRQHVLNNLK